MEMKTLRHWIAGTLAVCAAIGIWAVSNRRGLPESGGSQSYGAGTVRITSSRGPERSRATQARVELRRARYALAAAEVRDRFLAARADAPSDALLVLDDVPAEIVEVIDEKAAHLQSVLGAPGLNPVAVAAVWSSIEVGAGMHYMLPEITDGHTCLVILALSTWNRDREDWTRFAIDQLRDEGGPYATLNGPCSFYAAFGQPGAGMRSLLKRWEYDVIRLADWDRTPVLRVNPLGDFLSSSTFAIQLAAAGGPLRREKLACASGRVTRCGALLASGMPTDELRLWNPEAGRPALEWIPPVRDPSEMSYFLSDVVRALGTERFRELWTSDQPVETTFRAAVGLDLAAWTAGWMQQAFGPLRFGPNLRATEVFWLLALVALCVAAAVVLGRRGAGSGERGAGDQ